MILNFRLRTAACRSKPLRISKWLRTINGFGSRLSTQGLRARRSVGRGSSALLPAPRTLFYLRAAATTMAIPITNEPTVIAAATLPCRKMSSCMLVGVSASNSL